MVKSVCKDLRELNLSCFLINNGQLGKPYTTIINMRNYSRKERIASLGYNLEHSRDFDSREDKVCRELRR